MDEITIREEINTWLRDKLEFNKLRPATTLENRARKIFNDVIILLNDGK